MKGQQGVVSASSRLLEAAAGRPKRRQAEPQSVGRLPNVKFQCGAVRRPGEPCAAGFGGRQHSATESERRQSVWRGSSDAKGDRCHCHDAMLGPSCSQSIREDAFSRGRGMQTGRSSAPLRRFDGPPQSGSWARTAMVILVLCAESLGTSWAQSGHGMGTKQNANLLGWRSLRR